MHRYLYGYSCLTLESKLNFVRVYFLENFVTTRLKSASTFQSVHRAIPWFYTDITTLIKPSSGFMKEFSSTVDHSQWIDRYTEIIMAQH